MRRLLGGVAVCLCLLGGCGDTGGRKPGGDDGGIDGDVNGIPGAAALWVATGGDHSCAKREGGDLKCWGWNGDGELGLGNQDNYGDSKGEMGDALPAVDLGVGREVVVLATGATHSCALLDDATVKCWGMGYAGKLGLGTTLVRGDGPDEMGDALPAVDLGTGHTALAVAAGGEQSCAILEDRTVKCWGDGEAGGLGQGSLLPWGDGPHQMGDNLPPVDLGVGVQVLQVAAGGAYTCARLDDGGVKCWGDNAHGTLGLGDQANRGDEPGEMGDALPRVDLDLGAGAEVVSLAAGRDHVCALLEGGAVKCWGSNEHGQLGQGDLESRGDDPGEMGDGLLPVNLGDGAVATAISAGKARSCALLADHRIKCWGWGEAGALGQGAKTDLGGKPGDMGDALPAVDLGTDARAASLASGGFHNCAVLEGGALKCWGQNTRGQLGQGDIGDRGEQVGDMGDALKPVDLGD